jgi:hypothetical protein
VGTDEKNIEIIIVVEIEESATVTYRLENVRSSSSLNLPDVVQTGFSCRIAEMDSRVWSGTIQSSVSAHNDHSVSALRSSRSVSWTASRNERKG